MSTAFNPDPVNASENIFVCPDRVSPGQQPRDITAIKERYLPFDATNSTTHTRSTIFGAPLYRTTVSPGDVFQAHQGKRLVLEVGCSTIIFIHIEVSNPQKHHRIFIQSDEAFNFDTTLRRDAAEIARNTRHIDTIVRFEIYFIMGVLSTLGLGMWLAVTGADVTVLVARKRGKVNATKKFSTSFLRELYELNKVAPVLTSKIISLVETELSDSSKRSVREVPSVMASDEKTVGQISGVVFGKLLVSDKPFSAAGLLTAVIGQIATKSLTNFPSAFIRAAEARYSSLIESISSARQGNPAAMVSAANDLLKIFNDSGMTVTAQEAKEILQEVKRNPQKIANCATHIATALDELLRAAR